jgi:hypothetical protein
MNDERAHIPRETIYSKQYAHFSYIIFFMNKKYKDSDGFSHIYINIMDISNVKNKDANHIRNAFI